jgi:PAS domain S-box-containing protein
MGGVSISVTNIRSERPGVRPNWSAQLSSLRDYREYAIQFVAVFASYSIAGKLGQATASIRSSNLGPVWPAYGVALAAVLICGYRIWPAVASAAFLIAFLSPEPYLTALGQATGATLAALAGSFVLHRFAKFDNSLSRLRDALALVVLGGLGSAVVSASIGVCVLNKSHVYAYSGLGSAWLIYWLGDSTGVLLVTPLALTVPNLRRIRGWSRLAELIGLLLLLTAACMIVFNNLPVVPVRMIAFGILPLIIWAAIRFGVSGAALSIFLVATIATVETALGSGSFASSTPFINGVQLDAFLAVLSLTGLTFAALYAERDLAERERAQSLREQVAMEIRLQNQQLLRASEERLRLAQSVARIATFEWNIRTGADIWTPELEAMHGLPRGGFGGTQTAWENLVHAEDRARVTELVSESRKTGQPTGAEWRVVWPDGSVHWIAGRWQVLMSESGEPLRMVGVNADITESKRAEQTVAEMARKLVQAQEQERARISRELHDDINQRLALLALGLGQLRENPSEMQSRLEELRKETMELSTDVQALSHDLHPSKLEYLGVVAGIRSWSREFAQRQDMEIDFKSDVSSALPAEIGICLFRVLQEALHNVIKHSGVKRVEVRLMEHSNQVHLMVSDSGKGFEGDSAMQGKGLGLTSMRERVRMVHGTIVIESKPMGGTTIEVRVPLESQHSSQRAS